ncbi:MULTISPECIES: XTP/dITP diphosphatase [Staphylococcus]|uniref:dITP/XTP pyrophosphatase n=1 Tax=Staphylococcus simulans UMC-CNS-990 TaxID=1405498 RepID=A0ABN0PCN4_STASI|nr:MULTISPECIES: XTP/dITP diphosphatase [Staphylococcus]ERS93335.1 deoxyribonucleotide triphosphate pyrophosphatase [Staphylococcus simulans UMC-CNS-990]KXA45994.1 non-canonical purine NTP pyrophosphatase, RdgB/HAM1 family [Staphylococcus simulans]MDK7926706.1 XTP/dITP diphosphatase [Staphylococcus simulans]MDK8315325.1 XTP/dITP diphosphatase [Staphylococcus simulans]MDN6205342.1 XTP/dITP diphosphatase [Staphylococcus simulans]
MEDLVIATNNKGKINDFKVIFPEYNVIGISELISDFDVEETGTTFEENAKLKSEAAAQALGKRVIADDSGLTVDALNGEPGIYSARYAGEDKDDNANIEKLLEKLKGNSRHRTAEFVCVISMSAPGEETVTFEGTVSGVITMEKLGEHGFGYDPIFYVPRMHKTMAQLTDQEKGEISHRRQAIDKLKAYLKGDQI